MVDLDAIEDHDFALVGCEMACSTPLGTNIRSLIFAKPSRADCHSAETNQV